MSTHSQVRSTLPTAENPPPRTHGLQDAGRQVSQTSPLMDAQQAAGMLGVPQTWLLAQARANAVPHHRLGHYVRLRRDRAHPVGRIRTAPTRRTLHPLTVASMPDPSQHDPPSPAPDSSTGGSSATSASPTTPLNASRNAPASRAIPVGTSSRSYATFCSSREPGPPNPHTGPEPAGPPTPSGTRDGALRR